MRVLVNSFQPFQSRVGVDTVLRLRFAYDPGVVALLKAALRSQALRFGGSVGGWLAEHKSWFVERAAWPSVKDHLTRHGHEVVVEGDSEREEAKAPPRAPKSPRGDLAKLARAWFSEMSMRWHPDRGGSDQAMAAVNDGHERLLRLLNQVAP